MGGTIGGHGCAFNLHAESHHSIQSDLSHIRMLPGLDVCGFGKIKYKLLCKLDMRYAIQFVKNYNRNTKQTKIITDDGQEKVLTLSVDAV